MFSLSFSKIQFLGLISLLGLLASCTDVKVDDYPLPRHGGRINIEQQTANNGLINDISNPNTVGSGIGDPTILNPDQTGTQPTLPPFNPGTTAGSVTNPNTAGVTPPVNPPTNTGNVTPPTNGKSQIPYAIPVPGDPYTVISPYDNKRVSIRQANGKPIPSGKKIRAKGETDPNKMFIIP